MVENIKCYIMRTHFTSSMSAKVLEQIMPSYITPTKLELDTLELLLCMQMRYSVNDSYTHVCLLK